ncbi:TetR/AcrR family transcriptional regulator [Magnetovibrio sp. PR-2]|uniref:TetR/AcrR family transcriptional regulator n=1 Tax=Magnetovibrio sp. PR-2 TaxID=3120356 RepID=UPI002FCDEB8D
MTDRISSPSSDASARPRKRMEREEREAHIVEEAIQFFAENGFEGKTRDLADRIGITQPLLYRYFPSKESLIERVYEEVYVSRWDTNWETMVVDRDRPLQDRLTQFYKEYAKAVYDYVWVRIFVFSGLRGIDINNRYLGHLRSRYLEPVCLELRHAYGLPDASEVPISDEEVEHVWSLHGMFFYRGIRHFVYGLPITEDVDGAIDNEVRTFLNGAHDTVRDIVARQNDSSA